MKIENYKTKVKGKIREAAFEHLKNLKSKHTKMKNLKYDKLELAQYMNSPLFDYENVKLLLALRTRTLRGIKADFRGTVRLDVCMKTPYQTFLLARQFWRTDNQMMRRLEMSNMRTFSVQI